MKFSNFLSTLIVVFIASGCSNNDAIDVNDNFVRTVLAERSKVENVQLKGMLGYYDDCGKTLKQASEFCQCALEAEGKSEITGTSLAPSERSDFVEKTGKNTYAFLQAIKHCEQFSPIPVDFSVTENSVQAQNILRKFEGKILTPDNVNNMPPINHPIGWTYKMDKPDAEIDFNVRSFSYKGKDDYGYLFSYAWENVNYYYVNGIMHYKNKNSIPMALTATSPASCTFVIGECLYDDSGITKKVITQFKNGVWVRNIGSYSMRFRTVTKTIYDINGIPLYKHSMTPSGESEEIRYEKK